MARLSYELFNYDDRIYSNYRNKVAKQMPTTCYNDMVVQGRNELPRNMISFTLRDEFSSKYF